MIDKDKEIETLTLLLEFADARIDKLVNEQPTVSNPLEHVVMCFDSDAGKTDDIEYCGNKGCGFNVNEKCKANGTECFGYIDVEGE